MHGGGGDEQRMPVDIGTAQPLAKGGFGNLAEVRLFFLRQGHPGAPENPVGVRCGER